MNDMIESNVNSCTPMVSVVMIAYNKEKYIEDAIRGVVFQKTNFEVELIIMDDCSTDSTPQIISQYQKRFPHIIKSFRNPTNLGLQKNYIEGFKHVTGKYMAICDADDYWFDRSKLKRQVAYMEEHSECALTFHRVINFYEDSGEKSLSNGGQPIENTLESLSRSNYITNLSVMYRSELVNLKSLPEWLEFDKSPDYAMHMLYAVHGSIHFFSRPMGVYRKASGSAWSMTDEFKRLQMSLTVRLHLIRELNGREQAVAGLKSAAVNILVAMFRVASSDSELCLAAKLASEAGLLGAVTEKVKIPIATPKSKLSKRIIRAVSKFVPLPRP